MINHLKMKGLLSKLPFCIVIFSLFSPVSLADDHDHAQALVRSGKILSLEIILQNLYKIEKGHILEVELERKADRLVYEIELVNEQGRVTEYLFDAKTGDLINEKIEH